MTDCHIKNRRIYNIALGVDKREKLSLLQDTKTIMVRRKGLPRSERSQSRPYDKSRNTPVINNIVKRKSKVLQEIKYLRNSTNLLIPKLPFGRLVRQIIFEIFPRLDIQRIQASALEALQEAAELYLVQFFEDSVLLTFHAKRVTLMRNDMILLRRLRGRDDIINK